MKSALIPLGFPIQTHGHLAARAPLFRHLSASWHCIFREIDIQAAHGKVLGPNRVKLYARCRPAPVSLHQESLRRERATCQRETCQRETCQRETCQRETCQRETWRCNDYPSDRNQRGKMFQIDAALWQRRSRKGYFHQGRGEVKTAR
jgi:hypothetical protein